MKYSRQREAILSTLRGVSCHPTAAWIYDRVRQEIPNISLATVYRNLAALRDVGDIISFTPQDGVERFDAMVTPHDHMVCDCCGVVLDLPEVPKTVLLDTAAQRSGLSIHSANVLFHGVCASCKNRN